MSELKSKQLFRRKLENVYDNLMQRHKDSAYYSSPIVGAEREAVQKDLLSLVLPPSYRMGSGAIVDASGQETGQIDAVIEQPFSFSFPIASDANRLYMADTVIAAFEIKSDLTKQGDEAKKKIREIKSLRRFKVESDEIVQGDLLRIPSFIIAYKGQKDLNALEEQYCHPARDGMADGLLILESQIFVGRSIGGNHYEAKQGKAECILAFLACLSGTLSAGASRGIDLFYYIGLLQPGKSTMSNSAPKSAKKSKKSEMRFQYTSSTASKVSGTCKAHVAGDHIAFAIAHVTF